MMPELANLEAPERQKRSTIWKQEDLRTNTFAANSFCMDETKQSIS